MEDLLFDVEVNNKETCKNCEHRQRWQCNSKVFQYCGVLKSNRTDNGLLKIKCKTLACEFFETIKKEKQND